jgi:catechol 2,3-dioxygenase-like lactoylglutathione lyase family enzyme
MRGSAGFLIGVLVGALSATAVAQGGRLAGDHYLNHVGISVENFDEAFVFYTQKMGFREAFTVRDDKGQPTLAYVQVSRNTFVELQPSAPGRPPGLSHFGLHVANLQDVVTTLKQRGVTVEDPRAGRQDSSVANATGPGGTRIELFEFGPGSLQGQAIASWK